MKNNDNISDNSQFKSDPNLDQILSKISLKKPIDIVELTSKFSAFWVDELKNSLSDEYFELWSKIFQTLNEADTRNSGPAYNKYYVIPAPTGSGKTQSSWYYVAELAIQNKHSGVAILTKFTSEVDEAVEKINKIVGRDVAIGYYTGTNIKDKHNEEEIDKYQVVVTTHQYFKLNHHKNAKDKDTYNKVMSFNGNERSTVIVDEAIELLDTFKITKSTVSILETKAHILSRKYESKDLELESQLLSYIDNNFLTLFFNDYVKTKVRHIEDNLSALKNISLELNESIDTVKKLFNLDNFIEAIQSKHLDKIDLITKGQKTKIIDNAKSLVHLLDDSLYLYNNQEYISSALEKPTLSTVVFDATADINKLYDNIDYATVVQPLPQVKRYDNVVLNYLELDVGLGGDNIDKNLKYHFNNLTLLYRNIKYKDFDDNIVVFTKKTLREYCEKQEIPSDIDHFGNLVGVNRYKDDNHILIYGIPYKPDSLHYNNLYQSFGNDVFNNDLGGVISDLAHTNISSDIIQAINRGSCRKVVNGQAPETHIYLALAKRESRLNQRILSDIKTSMPGININDWDIDISDIKNKDTQQINSKFKQLIDEISNSNSNKIKLSKLPGYASLSDREKRTAAQHLENTSSSLSKKIKEYGYSYQKNGQHYLLRN